MPTLVRKVAIAVRFFSPLFLTKYYTMNENETRPLNLSSSMPALPQICDLHHGTDYLVRQVHIEEDERR